MLKECYECRCDLENQMQQGYVYASESVAFPGQLKLGKAKNLKQRLSSMNTSCKPIPHTMVAVAQTMDRKRDEKLVHQHFAHVRETGEFFRVTKEEVQVYFTNVITKQYERELSQTEDQLPVTIDRQAINIPSQKLLSGELGCSAILRKRFFSVVQEIEQYDAANKATRHEQIYHMKNVDAFDSMSAESRSIYAKASTRGTYSNLCFIRWNGSDIEDFLLGMKKSCNSCYADYITPANQLASDIFCMFTELKCPFRFYGITQNEMHKCLECKLQINEHGMKTMTLSHGKTCGLYTMYQQWINLDRNSHTPSYTIKQQDAISFKQSVTILNQVLTRMYAIKLVSGNQQQKQFFMQDLLYFQEESENMGKPILPAWRSAGVDQRLTVAFLMD